MSDNSRLAFRSLDASGKTVFTVDPLIYQDMTGVNVSSYTNLLLVDKRVKDYQDFITFANPQTFTVAYSSNSSRDDLFALVSSHGFNHLNRIGLVFETNDNGSVYSFLNRESWFIENDINGSENFSPNMTFVIHLVKTLGIINIDFLACNTLKFNHWINYYAILKDKTGVIVGASNDATGNIKYGGDWVMESTGTDVENLYFTSGIEYHTYLLETAYVYQNYVSSGNYTNNTNYTNTSINKVLFDICGNTSTFTNTGIVLGGGGSGAHSIYNSTNNGFDGAHALVIETGKTVTNLVNKGCLTGGGAGGGYSGGDGGAGGGGGAGGNELFIICRGGIGASAGVNAAGVGVNNFYGSGGGGGAFGIFYKNGGAGGNGTDAGGGGGGGAAGGGIGGIAGTGSDVSTPDAGISGSAIFGGGGGGGYYGGGGGGAGGGGGGYAGGGGGSGGGIGGSGGGNGGNGGFGIKNYGTITTLSNSQNLSMGYGPLYIAGNAPTNYNIIIEGDTSYGQLFASPYSLSANSGGNIDLKITGNVLFGIDPVSVLSPGTKTYTNVLSCVNPTTLSNSGTTSSYSYTWTLNENNITNDANSPANTIINYDLSVTVTPIVITKASCLLEGTLVLTTKGYLPIETLKPGDTIVTKNYYINITKVGKWVVDLNNEQDREDLSKKMHKISAGTYGTNRDTFISHYHRILVDETPDLEKESRVFRLPTNMGLPIADPCEYAKNGKYNLYHLQLVIGNHFIVNGGCMVESWQENAKNF
jgi:hypothetical protein